MSVSIGASRAASVLKLSGPLRKHRNVVVGPWASVAARTGAEQHDVLDPVAIDLVQRLTESREDGDFSSRRRHAFSRFRAALQYPLARSPMFCYTDTMSLRTLDTRISRPAA